MNPFFIPLNQVLAGYWLGYWIIKGYMSVVQRMNFKYSFIFIFILACSLFGKVQAQNSNILDGDSLNRIDEHGLKQGIWREMFNKKKLFKETTYENGLKEGIELTYWKNPNCIKKEAQYHNDTLDGYVITYYRGCRIKMILNYKEGQREGYVRKYNRKGQLTSEGLYKNNKLDGIVRKFETSPSNEPTAEKVRNIDLEEYINEEQPILDSIILKSLNEFDLTSETVIVTDVTGSMYGYVGQLLLWYKFNIENEKVNKFTFFNDGDNKKDFNKVIGKTGGIYHANAVDLVALKKMMELAINSGNGGDMQENNVEAILSAIQKFKRTKQIILIADRLSPVRDMSLLPKIKVPVHVVLCGSNEYTNPQYLDIAYKTGGNLYTMDEQIIDVSKIKEGQKLKIAALTFVFRSGKFRRVSN